MADEDKKAGAADDDLGRMLGLGPEEEEAEEEEIEEEEQEDEDDEEDEDDADDEEEGEDGEEEEEEGEEDEGEEEDDDGDDVGALLEDEEEEEGEGEADDEEEEGEDGEATELQKLREENARLKGEMAEEEEEEEQQTVEEIAESIDLGKIEFIDSDEAYDQAMENREAFNEILVEVAKKTASTTVKHVLTQIPAMVARQVHHESTNAQAVTDFYTANPDLTSAKKFVAYVFRGVQAENPDMDLAEQMNLTATSARAQLGITGKAGGKGKKKGKKTRKPHQAPGPGRSSRRGKPKAPAGIGDEIAQMERA
ncbi:hypothetical protein HN911_11670 [Candidatus Bathyarchaeota archaeon]|nr:hypothetical protein [Candidatus Bathyarchaeota archaeon]